MFQLYSNILVQGITIIAPVKSPNTDGINPGSSYKHKKNKCFDLWQLIINVSCHIQLIVNKIHLAVWLWSSGFRAPKRKLYFNLSHTLSLSLSLFLSLGLSFLCVSFHIFYLMKLDDVVVAICNKVDKQKNTWKRGSLFCAISGHALQRRE